MNVAILTAGGIGSRMNNKIPKQFLTVNEIPIIIYTLQKFQNNKNIDKIVVSCLKEWQPVLNAYKQEFNISKLDRVVEGGETGLDSIENSLLALDELDDDDCIIVHDGNRPLVSDDIINNNIKSCDQRNGTTTITDINDGIIKVDENNNAVCDLPRKTIKHTQTPHCFKYKMIKNIFKKITDKNEYISVANAAGSMGYGVKLVYGSDLNFKITVPDDLVLFKAIVDSRSIK